MIKLVEVEKLYKKKGQKNLSIPVYIVGQEKDQVYLIAREDYFPDKTAIELVDTLKRERRVIYIEDSIIKCVSASINQDRNILTFTTISKKTEDSPSLYESHLVELGEKPSKYTFNVKGSNYQCIQFIPGQSKNLTYFLFFKEKEKIEMYAIQKKGLESHPERQGTFVQKYLWSQWDCQYSLLYYLEREKTNGYVLRCCSFASRPSVSFERDNLQLNLPKELGKIEKFPWKNGHSSPDSSIHFEIVKTPAPILCQQILHNELNDGIPISLYVLHHNVKINITIPIKERYHVFFGSMNGLVMIYIPGIYLQLVDVDKDHYPRELLTWTENVPILLNQKSEPHCLHLKSRNENGYLMDFKKGHIFEYDLDKDYLLKWLSTETNPKSFIKMIHLAFTHFKDDKFSDDVLNLVFKNLYRNISTDVISECLLALSFIKVKHMDEEFLRIIPMSTEENKSTLETFKINGEYHIIEPYIPRIPPKVTVIDLIKSNINYSKEYYYKLEEKKQNTFSGFFSQIFSSPSKSVLLKADPCRIFQDTFIEQLKDKRFDQNKVNKWAQEYSIIINDLTHEIYKKCLKETNETRSSFLLLEKFYCALEDTGFPPPVGFYENLTLIGYRVLPYRIFLQYIQRNIFVVTEQLIDVLIKERKFDSSIIYAVLKRFDDKNKEILYHEKLNTEISNLIQYHHSNLPKQMNPQELLNLYNKCLEQNESVDQFAPLQFYLLSLEEGSKKREFDFIKEKATKHFIE